MPPLVSTKVSGESGSPWTTPSIDTTGSKFIVIGVSRVSSSGVVTISDTVGGVASGNVWTPLTEVGDTNSMLARLYYCENPVVGVNHAFRLAITGSDWAGVMAVGAWATAYVFDKQAAVNGGSSTTRQPGAVNPTLDNSLVISVFTAEASSALAINSGFTIFQTQNRQGSPFVFGPFGLAYLEQAAHAAANPTWTLDAPDYNVTTIAAFSPPSASGTVTGTAAPTRTGIDVRANPKTYIVTLTNDTFNVFDDVIRAAIRDGIDSASAPAWGWDAVKAQIPLANIVRTSATVCTITVPALPDYQSDTPEVLTITLPAAAVVGAINVVATPTVAITAAETDLTPVGDYNMSGTATRTRP